MNNLFNEGEDSDDVRGVNGILSDVVLNERALSDGELSLEEDEFSTKFGGFFGTRGFSLVFGGTSGGGSLSGNPALAYCCEGIGCTSTIGLPPLYGELRTQVFGIEEVLTVEFIVEFSDVREHDKGADNFDGGRGGACVIVNGGSSGKIDL